MTRVKICGLTSADDALNAWRSGADLLGFIFVPTSPRFVQTQNVAAITAALRAEGCLCRLVGVFAGSPVEEVRHVIAQCELDLAQLHGGESPEFAAELGAPTIVARQVKDVVPWAELAAYDAWAYLLDTHVPERQGGTGQSWNWDLLGPPLERPGRVIIAGGLRPGNVAWAIRRTRPWGVDVSSGVEAEPGRKDAGKVARFIEAVREEDRRHANT